MNISAINFFLVCFWRADLRSELLQRYYHLKARGVLGAMDTSRHQRGVLQQTGKYLYPTQWQEGDHQWKKTSKYWISQQPLVGFSSNFKLKLSWPNQNYKCSKGRRPSMEPQQPWIGFSSNLKLKIRGPNQNKKCLKWRQPPIEDDLKISKVEYLSNHWPDLSQILNLSLGDQTKIKNAWNKDDLQWTTSKY